MADNTEVLLAAVQKRFAEYVDQSDRITRLYAKARDGNLDYNGANDFAIQIGNAMAKAFKLELDSSILPGGSMPYDMADTLMRTMLGDGYGLVSTMCEAAQTYTNTAAGLGLKAIRPELDNDRIYGIIKRLAEAEQYDDVAWILGEPIVNYHQAVVDDSVRINAQFHFSAGLKPQIQRTCVGGCCQWCSDLAGRYDYSEVKNRGNDIYKRHERCRCTLTYMPDKFRRQKMKTSGKAFVQ